MSLEQIREDNTELQETKRRLEKRLHDVQNLTEVEGEITAILEIFDHNFEAVLTDLMGNRLRFNTLVRLFFSGMVVQVDRPGAGWRKGKKKGELPICNARIKKFALEPRFAAFVDQSGIGLPSALRNAERYSENLSESHGSPSLRLGSSFDPFQVFKVLKVLLLPPP